MSTLAKAFFAAQDETRRIAMEQDADSVAAQQTEEDKDLDKIEEILETPATDTPVDDAAPAADDAVPAATDEVVPDADAVPEVPEVPEVPAVEVTDEVPTDVRADEVAVPADDAVTDAIVEPVADVTPAEPVVEEAAAPVEPPVAQAASSDPGVSVDQVEAVNQISNLLDAASGARSAKEVIAEVAEVTEGVQNVRDVAEVINEDKGGVTIESLALLSLSLESFTNRLGLPAVDLGVDMESFATPGERKLVSMEAIDELLRTLQSGGDVLDKRSVESLSLLVEKLKEAVATAKTRLATVISQASMREGEIEGSVDVSDGLATMLGVNGAIPDDLGEYFRRYGEYGQIIVGDFVTAAFQSAMEASSFPTSLCFENPEGFWKSVAEKAEKIGDPRKKFTAQQLEMAMPNGTALFTGPAGELNTANEALKLLTEYTVGFAPLDPVDVTKTEAAEGSSATRKALQPSEIKDIGNSLYAIFEKADLSKLAADGTNVWPSALAAVKAAKEVLVQAPESLQGTMGVDTTLIPRYLDTVFSLSAYPALHFLTNLVFTSNAIVLYAERSLSPIKAPEPEPVVEAPVVDETVPADDAVGEEIPAVDDVATDDAAPAADDAVPDDVAATLAEAEDAAAGDEATS